MCGIVGYIGSDFNALEKVKVGLCALEYRGYDSAGISYFENNKIETIKSVGAPLLLFKKVNLDTKSNLAIAHTRWATHGKVNELNAHPHVSKNGTFSVVHNGIIENYLELKNKYLKDYTFKSETDSEVIANLLEKFFNGNVLETLNKVIGMLKGCFALAIVCKEINDKIFFAKKNMSLLIGCGRNFNTIASDSMAFDKNVDKCVNIPNLSYGSVKKDEIEIYNFKAKKLPIKIENICEFNRATDLNNFPYYMEKEIYEIKLALNNTLNFYSCDLNKLGGINRTFFDGIKYIKILACGTSYHASLIGQKLFESAGYLCDSEIASEFIYNNSFLPKNTLAIFVSQSGETADTLEAVNVAKRYGAKTLAVTNVVDSAITKICDKTLYLKAGGEKAVASTKAYNTQLLVFYLLKSFICGQKEFVKFIEQIKLEINKLNIKNMHKLIISLVNVLTKSNNIFIVGRDFDYITSLEASLKIKEITYKNCEGFASGELKHGTLALVEKGTTVIAFITEKHLIDKTLNIVSQAKARGAIVIIISQFNVKKLKETSDYFVKLAPFSENIMPMFSIIPIQLLAYETSLALGHNPDKPRNLAKSVTVE